MQVAVLGYGTVGSGVVEVLQANKESIAKKATESIEVKYILDIREFENHPLHHCFTKSIEMILEDDEVKIVAEAMGGIYPAYDYIKAALQRRKSVITSNKELVAAHGPELLYIARENKVNFLFEASVGGGIPIIRPLNNALTADDITEITGILNGTTNFILTKMKNEGRDFEDVLKEAQQLGYAERNPEADVEGHDTCRKIAILSSLAFGEHVNYSHIQTTGITQITKQDIADAQLLGKTIKLLGSCRKQGGHIFASVEPVMIPKDHPLSMVEDVFNAVFLKGNMVGDVMFYGRGAGKLPTASAMVADMIDATRHKGVNITTLWSREQIELTSNDEMKAQYYVRLSGEYACIKTLVEEIFGKVEEITSSEGYTFITPHDTQKNTNLKIESLKGCQLVSQIRIQK